MASKTSLFVKTFLGPPYVFARGIYDLAGGDKHPCRAGFLSASITTASVVTAGSLISIGISAIQSYLSGDYSSLYKEVEQFISPLNLCLMSFESEIAGVGMAIMLNDRPKNDYEKLKVSETIKGLK